MQTIVCRILFNIRIIDLLLIVFTVNKVMKKMLIVVCKLMLMNIMSEEAALHY